ncbi:type II toxin-antitoxin system RelB family antitoxin [Acidipropionibacterium virtanenii]|uniref:Ribbon-helix-helix protein CopG domain-containing protein n=1 Tax=Acidipropionibacterium virtanenii TaxID=2057246 RepID=A0A344URA2_9ACTN|nr:ribbon-helix-helix protein, CopG family [Acidipropionibacterium virtanenii]AXE37800.1 hypothetical protein JS278_00608 [Acidipropionibacterium virtanenii]
MTVAVRLTPDEEARLDALARRTGRTKSFYVRTAVREYLDGLEDAYTADWAIKDFTAGGARSRPLSELASTLDLTADDVAEGRAALRQARGRNCVHNVPEGYTRIYGHH